MEDKDKTIQELYARLEQLTRQQKVFQDEIYRLTADLHQLTSAKGTPQTDGNVSPVKSGPKAKVSNFVGAQRTPSPSAPAKEKRPWEEFIGTNLLNKVGIAVLILGIGFGTKYSIDNKLIEPLTRIILGYLSGITLIALALRLRARHTAFSAVLLSGGMAALYFITYAAHSAYGLIPQVPAFILMVLFTCITVLASLRYSMEVISIIGLVGAYAVPLLLSDGSGRVLTLFSYITIINTGILVLAFKKYWKLLYYLAFALTWLTFASWYVFLIHTEQQPAIGLIFSTIFFVTFYVAFLAYKLIRAETLAKGDVIAMLVNTFIYFAYGYLTVDSLQNGAQHLGLFTVFTAFIHFIACVIVYKAQARSNDIFYFVAGMALIFLTIAVPVQLEGNWVTLVWAGEAALMFWIGRSKSFPSYERLSYPLIVLAFISLLHDWGESYPAFHSYTFQEDADFTIFLNIQFLTSMLVGAGLVFILLTSMQKPVVLKPDSIQRIFTAGVPVLVLIVLYTGFYKEIEAFWNHQYAASKVSLGTSEGVRYDQYDPSLLNFKTIWLIIFSALFSAGVFMVQLRWQTQTTAVAALAIGTLVVLSFITFGLFDLTMLRENYLTQDLATHYPRGSGHVLIRYLAMAVVVPLLWFNRRLSRQHFFSDDMRKAVNLFFHLVVIVVLSSELIHWLDIIRVENSFRLSLSILWGTYALLLIVFGLSRDLRHIRLGAIVLFAVTLLKLFLYDMAGMSTILKTVVMIILGALLLTASFIYNKHKRSAGNEAP